MKNLDVTGALASLALHSDALEEDWRDQALCAQTDAESFFPEKGGSSRAAKKICQSCDVREQCLQAALDNDERFGIWGGLSERERRGLKHRSLELTEATAPGPTPRPAAPAAVQPPEGTAA